MVTAAKLRKNAVITTDTPGFVVNRLLAKVLGEAMHAVDTGTPFEVVEESHAAVRPADDAVRADRTRRLKVGAHVLDTHHAAFPDRFFESKNLHKLAELGQIFEREQRARSRASTRPRSRSSLAARLP